MQDVNLIPEEIRRQKEQQSQLRGLYSFSLLFLAISLLGSLGLFGYKYNLQNVVNGIKAEITKEDQKIASLKPISEKLLVLVDKLNIVSSVVYGRPLYSRLLTQVGAILPQDVNVTDLNTISEDKVSISGSAGSYITLSQLLRNIIEASASKDSIFESAELTSVSLKENSSNIEFSMNVMLKKGSLKYADSK